MTAIHYPKTLLFDLDGTLSDPGEGIFNCIAFAMEHMGRAAPSAAELAKCVGPPLRSSFGSMLGSDDSDLIEEAMRHYRQRYITEEKGVVENRLYPEMPSVLERLRGEGRRMYVVTSKPTDISKKIVRHFSLDEFFVDVYGSELDGKHGDKGELLAHILGRENIQPHEAVMIGDREHDIIAAKKNRVGGIGVCWGYGSAEELTGAGAMALAGKPGDLLELLLSGD